MNNQGLEVSREKNLSLQAKSLWAKSPQFWEDGNAPDGSRLPLYKHMRDSCEIGKKLWDNWVSPATKRLIYRDPEVARSIFLFLAATHDIGKATLLFQMQRTRGNLIDRVYSSGLPSYLMSITEKIPHSTAGEIILGNYLKAKLNFSPDEADSFGAVAGGHHGRSPIGMLSPDERVLYFRYLGINDEQWGGVQNELLDYVLFLIDIDFSDLTDRTLCIQAQVALTGLVIMADWLASDTTYFPYESQEYPRQKTSASYAESAWEKLSFYPRWNGCEAWADKSNSEFMDSRFDLPSTAKLYPTQNAVIEIAKTVNPGIIVIEAPMGEGKTEAALLAAEIFAQKTGRTGVFFALPTQATTNGIFPRLKNWIDRLDNETHSIILAHGKAHLNEEYRGLGTLSENLSTWEDEQDDEHSHDKENGSSEHRAGKAAIHEWMSGRKKSLLADFAAGTIDQVLLGALKQKHLVLRHLGLMDKVVIVDECHAYDAYMNQYLEQVLGWLGSYGVPVIVLSATLPAEKRQSVVKAYLGQKDRPKRQNLSDPTDGGEDDKKSKEWMYSREYPLITYSDGRDVCSVNPGQSDRSNTIAIGFLPDETDALLEKLGDILVGGGCACVICNTVKKAQETAALLSRLFGEQAVELFHSQYISIDRANKESKLRRQLGRGGERPQDPYIVVGTQVLEQSLDVDFDIMVTEIAPIDLMLQRMGRLHRHFESVRPPKLRKAQCFIMGAAWESELPEFDKGTEAIYGKYLLMGTLALLKGLDHIVLPCDIPELIQDVYQQGGPSVPAGWVEEMDKAQDEYKAIIENQKVRAKSFRIRNAYTSSDLAGWLDYPSNKSSAEGEATVRDAGDSLEVIVVRSCNGVDLEVLPWITEYWGTENRLIPYGLKPNDSIARLIANCTVNLPAILCTTWMIDRVIRELEETAGRRIGAWQESRWLKGALVLILDENYEARLHGYILKYDRKIGLVTKKEESDSGRKEV